MKCLTTMTNLEFEDIEKVATLPYNWGVLEKKNVLISGGTGFIGSFIVNVLAYRNEHFNSGTHVVTLSRHSHPNFNSVENVVCDINNPIRYDGPIDFIIHLASNTHPSQYSSDPVGTITTNVIGCNNLLKLGVEKKTKRFLLASSVEIYGQGKDEPMKEDCCGYIDCNKARSGYNESKRVCESLCQSYLAQYGIGCVIGRLSRVFGADNKKDTKAIAQFMDKALNGEDIVLKSYGRQRFSYSYVADAASGLLKVLLDGKNGEAYNISEEDEGLTLGEYATFIANLADKKVTYDIQDVKGASNISYAILDTLKIKQIGWSPLFKVSEGLERTYHIYKNRR